jgi:competence protein ComEC
MNNGNMWIYCLNVGQADTTLIITPAGKTILIDAVNPKKIVDLLTQLGRPEGSVIDHLIVTHPHSDHYSGVVALLNAYDVQHVTLSSIWQLEGSGAGYNAIINTVAKNQTPFTFLAGLVQIFPDGSPLREEAAPQLELLGPSHSIIDMLTRLKQLSPNHRSIIARLQLGRFSMVLAADSQMENWAHFDREQMMVPSCTVLRASHHGSANGTQYERLDRLDPRLVIVSSDPEGKHHLPDLIGCTIYRRFATRSNRPIVALTHATGTVKIEVRPTGTHRTFCYREERSENVPIGHEQALTPANNPTDWNQLMQHRITADDEH